MAEGITVTGTGQAGMRPDVLVVRFGAQITARDVSAALARCSAAMGAMTDSLSRAGIPAADLLTTGASVHTAYRREGSVSGWEANQELTARLRDFTRSGELISAAIHAGGNAARLHDVSFAADDTETAAAAAREQAMAQAKAKAEQLAGLAGVTLGRVTTIRELARGGGGGGVTRMAAFAATDESMPIAAGDLSVTTTVEVTWALT